MNPLYESQAEIQAVPATERVRALMEKQEAAEDRQRETAAYERIARAEAQQMMTIARQRREVFETGHTSEEMAQYRAEQEARRDARISELETELRRLVPDHPYFVRRSGSFDVDAKLAEVNKAAEANRRVIARAQLLAREEQELRRSTGPADCEECRDAGATQRESVAMHADGSLGAPVTHGGGYITRSA